MLDKESQAESKHRSGVIAWSESGKAFHIRNITEFANTILPKYFRTKKFSSFQRNLNLVSVLLWTIARLVLLAKL